jgi:hypothetical protein
VILNNEPSYNSKQLEKRNAKNNNGYPMYYKIKRISLPFDAISLQEKLRASG